jgi:hypothetical protein
VRYIYEGRIIYTSAVPPVYPLSVDTSFYTVGGSLTGVGIRNW